MGAFRHDDEDGPLIDGPIGLSRLPIGKPKPLLSQNPKPLFSKCWPPEPKSEVQRNPLPSPFPTPRPLFPKPKPFVPKPKPFDPKPKPRPDPFPDPRPNWPKPRKPKFPSELDDELLSGGGLAIGSGTARTRARQLRVHVQTRGQQAVVGATVRLVEDNRVMQTNGAGVADFGAVQDPRPTVRATMAEHFAADDRPLAEYSFRQRNDRLEPGTRDIVLQLSPSEIIAVISVDWEGHDLHNDNLTRMEQFRQAWPNIPLTHFVCAGYLSNGQHQQTIATAMRRGIENNDEVGIHVHCWQSLLAGAGTGVVQTTNFWSNPNGVVPTYYNAWGDPGHDNPLTDYNTFQVRDIVNRSRVLLTQAGFNVQPIFRSGGWASCNAVLRGVRLGNCTIDSSAVAPARVQAIRAQQGNLNLPVHPQQRWNAIQPREQPSVLPIGQGQTIKELPDNGALADFATQQDMETLMTWASTRLPHQPRVLVQIGFHQETAHTLRLYSNLGGLTNAINGNYLNRIHAAMTTWQADNNLWPRIRFLTGTQATALFLP